MTPDMPPYDTCPWRLVLRPPSRDSAPPESKFSRRRRNQAASGGAGGSGGGSSAPTGLEPGRAWLSAGEGGAGEGGAVMGGWGGRGGGRPRS